LLKKSEAMKYLTFLCIVFALVLVQSVFAQPYDRLSESKNHSAKVYYSAGHETRAIAIAKRIDKAIVYFEQLLAFKPDVSLLVLSSADWSTYTSFPVYGMPHYTDNKTLIIAAEDNPFWKSFIPPLEQLPAALREKIQHTYKNEMGEISMQAFFDLLALHELGHAFHIQGGLTMQRKWLGELYPNILLHTYIAENEREMLPALTLFPQMVIGGGTKELKYTSLPDLETHFEELGKQYPKNYGWYQCRWHAAAATIYNSAGKMVCRNLWNALKGNTKILSDEELADFLSKQGDKSVADMMRNWDQLSVK
jgi:hypothetical protein